MSKFNRILAAMLALVLTVGMLVGCGGTPDTPEPQASTTGMDASEKPDTSEEVTLTMYLIGDRPVDNDEVFAKINERLKAEINATIDVKFMSWGEYEQKYPLIFASGEDWDIIYTADWCFYNAQATKQGFWEITEDALKTYAPKTAETMYEEAWEQAKVDGKVYMLPMNYKELTAYTCMVRGDLMDKYGIKSISTPEDMEKYLQAVADNEPSMIPVDVGSDFDRQFIYNLLWNKAAYEQEESETLALLPAQTMSCVDKNDDEANIQSVLDQPIFLETVKKMQDWKNRGFWSKNAVVNTQNNTESFQAGKSAMGVMNANTAKSLYSQISKEHPEWDIRVFDAQFGVPATLQPYLANGMSIFSKSKHPERALMALDYLRNDEICHNLFCYGIEGKHWEASGEDGLVSLPASGNYPYDGNCNWGIRNDQYWRTVEGGIPNIKELTDNWTKTARTGKYQSFVFDDSKVKNEIAALTEIYNSDFTLLMLGYTDDPEGDIAKVKEKMQAAGVSRVYEVMHEQAKAYLDSRK